MKKLRILFAMVVVALQSFIACKTDDISPQSLSQIAQNLAKENKLKKIDLPSQSTSIIYLKDIEKANQFFSLLKNNPKLSQSKTQTLLTAWISPRSEIGINAHGVFTFSENTKAEMKFDKKGNIYTLSINNEKTDISYDYDPSSGYLQITQWGIIAIPQIQNPTQFISSYDYYYAPITRWEAFLSSGWSRIQHLNIEANLTVEDFGKFEVFYTSLELPVIDPFRPSQEKIRDNPANQIIPIQHN